MPSPSKSHQLPLPDFWFGMNGPLWLVVRNEGGPPSPSPPPPGGAEEGGLINVGKERETPMELSIASRAKCKLARQLER